MAEHVASASELAPEGYDLIAAIGAGSAGTVWRARGPDGRIVALKIGRDDEARRSLAREARFLALALSPRLPELLDVGWTGGGPTRPRPRGVEGGGGRAFIALEWLDGAPLGRRGAARERHERALRVACDVGDALAELHAVGVAHGDVKPDNLVLTRDGRVRVVDLGLATSIHRRDPVGATPRYLARGDGDLGDGRARDLLAFGLVLAELVAEEVAEADDPVVTARQASLPSPFDAICAALLAPNPGGRPSARWAADRARFAASAAAGGEAGKRRRGLDEPGERAERDARLVRATYLALRRHELERAGRVREGAAPWLAAAVAQAARIRSIDPDPPGGGDSSAEIGPLGPAGVARWMAVLVGGAAVGWPMAGVGRVREADLAERLVALARRTPPPAWTFADVEAAAGEEVAPPPKAARKREALRQLEGASLTKAALGVSRVPPDPRALEVVERAADAPPELLIAAAETLSRLGEAGRARALVRRAAPWAAGQGGARAEVLRRSGDAALAAACARAAVDADADKDGRAAAVLARLALDRGALEEAEALCARAAPIAAPICEVAALAAVARGDVGRALEEVARGAALATGAEDRARFSALRGFALHETDPEAAHGAFRAAADDAARAGSVVEEATYRTGEAAAAVDVGALGSAIEAARRAALLWEHLGRPAMAARALLAAAAAYATAGVAEEATAAAEGAAARARDGGDVRAEAFALWAICDATRSGEARAGDAAERASGLLGGAGADDALRAGARLLRHQPGAVDAEARTAHDRTATDPATSAVARFEWWGARAEALVRRPGAPEVGAEAQPILDALAALAEARAPVGSKAPALAAGHELAARAGRGDLAARLLASLGDLARELRRRASPDLEDAVRSLPWVSRAAAGGAATMRPEQARDLEAIARSFEDRERLGVLLNRVVDALVLWTGVERGLLLLRNQGGRLTPRAARNLGRADLRGEQLALSTTLANRAVEAREPVVAVDASGEYGSLHQSVHSLKLRSVLAVPLIARGETLGVVYLDDRVRRGAFGERELGFTRTVASLAAIAIADARDRVLLRRSARQARRASERLAVTLAHREAALDAAERELAKARGARGTRFRYDAIVGESEAIREMLKLVDRVTTSDVPVLVVGESGSGKELVARAIHNNGGRAGHAFVSENCGAIPEGLLESALFGHVRGAFTGADRHHAGLFEVAHQGTLFLDEIGEMSLGMQAKLLRVLEDGVIRPLGSERPRTVNVRIITATHRDLEEMVRRRTFREDLYYRLNIFAVRIPPLRDRPGDIPLIVQHLVDKHGGERKVKVARAAMDRLIAFTWPGNVRRLENEVRRALLLCDDVVDTPHLSPDVATGAPTPGGDHVFNVRRRIDALERQLVREALERTGGNQTQAAKMLGLSRFGLQKMIKRLQIA